MTDEHQYDKAMIKLALEQAAAAAAMDEVPVGAVVFNSTTGEVIAATHNRREADHDPVAHAEILALQTASRKLETWRLEGYSLAVTLEPCPMCAGALVNARVDAVIYGATDPKMGCVDTLHDLVREPRFNHRLTVRSGVLAEECGEILRLFFRQKRKPKK